MEKQLEEMDQEEEHDVMLNYNKTYPYGLFNLASSSLFYKMPLMRRLKAIEHALQGDAAPPFIFYDAFHDIVCFYNNNNIFHRCNLRQRQFIVKSSLI
jgi:hypothetical protein